MSVAQTHPLVGKQMRTREVLTGALSHGRHSVPGGRPCPGFALPSVVLFEVPVQSLSFLCVFQGLARVVMRRAWLLETLRSGGTGLVVVGQPDDKIEDHEF